MDSLSLFMEPLNRAVANQLVNNLARRSRIQSEPDRINP